MTARLEAGFGAPVNGDLLYDVTGLTMAGGVDLDSTAPFVYKLAERIGRTTTKGRHIVGSGTIRGGRFRVDVFQQKTGTLTYSDRGAGERGIDGGAGRKRDSFAISLGSGYRRGGGLLSGGVTIR